MNWKAEPDVRSGFRLLGQSCRDWIWDFFFWNCDACCVREPLERIPCFVDDLDGGFYLLKKMRELESGCCFEV